MKYSNEKQHPFAKLPARPSPEIYALQKRIKDRITSASLLQDDTSIIIGVSGGPDSISLLHILSSLYPHTKRIAVYVDHGLRPEETEAEKVLVQKHATLCSAHFATVAVDVQGEQKSTGCSLEEVARTLRYGAFETIRKAFQASVIAVGHTADDQVEEVLLRLIRGSGSTGLSGMNIQQGKIIRPLLHVRKESLLSYLHHQGITTCQDSSNLDTRFLRNRIRLELLPLLEQEYNTSMRRTLLQTASILTAEDSLLVQLTNISFKKLVHKERQKHYLSLPDFSQEPLAIQRRILEKICWSLHSKPSFKNIEHLLKIALSSEHKEIHLSDGLRAVRERDSLLFHRPSSQKGYRGPAIIAKSFSPVSIPGPGEFLILELKRKLTITILPFSSKLLDTPNVQLVAVETILFPLLLRPAQTGERFHPLGAPGKKKISRFFSDHKIALMDRTSHPLLLSDEKVIAITGLRIDHEFRITDTTRQVLVIQWQRIEHDICQSSEDSSTV